MLLTTTTGRSSKGGRRLRIQVVICVGRERWRCCHRSSARSASSGNTSSVCRSPGARFPEIAKEWGKSAGCCFEVSRSSRHDFVEFWRPGRACQGMSWERMWSVRQRFRKGEKTRPWRWRRSSGWHSIWISPRMKFTRWVRRRVAQRVRTEGMINGERLALLRILARRLGRLPRAIQERIGQAGIEQVEGWIGRCTSVTSVSELFD